MVIRPIPPTAIPTTVLTAPILTTLAVGYVAAKLLSEMFEKK